MPKTAITDISTGVLLTSEGAAADLAAQVWPLLGAGDTLLLSGPIGAGKSHFARALISTALAEHGVAEDIPSPTFTLVQTYQAGMLEIWHSDLYRLTHVDEVYELGLFDAFETALCLVEWPDRLGQDAPKQALHLEFMICDNPDHRFLKLTATNEKWCALIGKVTAFGTEGPAEDG